MKEIIRCRAGIISDTHGLLRPEVLKELESCDVILHAGDMDCRKVMDRLRDIAPVYAVLGNNDHSWAESGPAAGGGVDRWYGSWLGRGLSGNEKTRLPESLTITLAGVVCFMIHDRSAIAGDISGADVVIYGHSHRYEEMRGTFGGKDQLWLNPGSCGPRRFRLPVTMAVMEIGENREIQVKRIEIPVNGIPADIRQRIPGIVKDMDRGRSMEEIARRAGVSRELAEQICRLYVTHPGVDVEGILRKMGL